MQWFLLRLRAQYKQCFILGSGVDGWEWGVGRSAPSKKLYPLLWMLATFLRRGGGGWKEEQTQSLTRVTKALAIPLAQRE